MAEITPDTIRQEVTAVVTELCEAAQLPAGSLFVVGCSSSEISGTTIGCDPHPEVGKWVCESAQQVLHERGIWLVAQCCEHLNRALVVEREAIAGRPWLVQVNARPVPTAGGSFATAAYESFRDPVVVETIQAEAGVDIGGTLIGMHLRAVASPVRLQQHTVGEASVIAARTRPKFIGGSRTQYDDSLAHTPGCPAHHQ